MATFEKLLLLLLIGLFGGAFSSCGEDEGRDLVEPDMTSPEPSPEPEASPDQEPTPEPVSPDCQPEPEVCDGLDNDCDNLIDEDESGSPLTEVCYEGPEQSRGVGECAAGTSTCTGGVFGPCTGQVQPVEEVCDGLDNNCDGETDEGFDVGLQCEVGVGACLRTGVTVCDSEGRESRCDASVGTPVAEVCDGEDNDCDGVVDEGEDEDPLLVDCYEGPEETRGVGLCTAGIQTCVEGELTGCVGQVLPSEDLCDGFDNDCDDRADEDYELGGDCSVGRGDCRAEGVVVCALNRREEVCGAVEGEASQEVCDDADNDCDGLVDEDEVNDGPLIVSCYDGPEGTELNGICAAGRQTCLGGQLGECVGQRTPETEVCDGDDNDCNGRTDELEICGGGGLCTNGSIEDCNPDGATLSTGGAFVDPQPPPGFVQCAGFRNTPQDDVRFDWENNCFGHEARLRIRGWNDETDELLWDATLTTTSDAQFTQLDSGVTNNEGSEGLFDCEGTPDNICGTTLWRHGTDQNSCGCTHPSGLVRCTDIFSANAGNDKVIYVGAGAGPDNEVFIAPPGGKNTCSLSDPVLRRVRVAIYEEAP